jgi:L-amino acid N-acyltransferase YncA
MEIESESEEVRVHAWRAEQLGKLGLSTLIAEAAADLVDWHEMAPLIDRGCPPELALEIAR